MVERYNCPILLLSQLSNTQLNLHDYLHATFTEKIVQ